MRFSVDPWDPAYGTSARSTEPGDPRAEVDVDVECPAARWRPVDPPPGSTPPEAVLFVDGVRRVDAQVWVRRAGRHRVARAVRLVRGWCRLLLRATGRAPGRRVVRRGLFTTAAAGADVATAAGTLPGHPGAGAARRCRRCAADAGAAAAAWPTLEVAVTAVADRPTGGDLLVVDGPLPAAGTCRGHRLHQDPPQHVPAARAGARGRRARAGPAHAGVPRSAARGERAAPGTCGCRARPARRGPGWCASSARRTWLGRGRRAGRAQPGDVAAVRLGRLQGPAGAAEPLPDRRAGTGASPPAGRADRLLPGAAPGRRRGLISRRCPGRSRSCRTRPAA